MAKTTELVLFKEQETWFGIQAMPGLQIGRSEPDIVCDFYTLFSPTLPPPHQPECIVLPQGGKQYGLWVAKVVKIQHKEVIAVQVPSQEIPVLGYTLEAGVLCLVLDFWALFA